MLNNVIKKSAILFAIVPVFAFAQVDGIKAFAGKAIEAEGKLINGTLSGQIATYFQSQTKSMQPVQVEAKMVKQFVTKGCGRVQLKIRQDIMVNGKAQIIQFPVEMNYCKDGTVPFDTTEIKGGAK